MRIEFQSWLGVMLLAVLPVGVRGEEPRATLDGHRDAVTCLAYAHDGKTLATGGADGTVRLWDTVALAKDDAADTPITAEEATKKVGAKVVVRMKVRATKERLEKFGEIYLDSEEDFRDPKNLGVVITKAAAAAFAEAGIKEPADHFKDKTIRVTGTVSEKDKKIRLIVEDPKQIEIVEKKD